MGDVVTFPANLLLIHGAWAGSWVWARIRPELEAMGYRVHTVDLPGNGSDNTPPGEVNLDRYLWFLSERISTMEGPVTLISHSGAGVIATALAEALPERIQAVVYIAGMMLPSGMSFGQLVQELLPAHPQAEGINPYLLWNEDRSVSRVPLIAAREVFFQDLDDETAIAAAQQLTAQPEGGKTLTAHWTAERAGQVPRLYIEATEDKSVTLAVQRSMQALVPGAKVVSFHTGHAPQVGKPVQVAEAIDHFLRTGLSDRAMKNH